MVAAKQYIYVDSASAFLISETKAFSLYMLLSSVPTVTLIGVVVRVCATMLLGMPEAMNAAANRLGFLLTMLHAAHECENQYKSHHES